MSVKPTYEDLEKRVQELEHENAALKQSGETQRLLSSITANMSESVVATNSNFEITYLNKKAEELFQYSVEEVMGKSPDIFNAEPLTADIQSRLYETVAAGKVYFGEHLNKRKDGTTFYCELKVFPLVGDNNQTYVYVGIQRNITDRKKSEASQQELRARTEAILAGIADTFYALDNQWRFTIVNPAAEKAPFGRPAAELIGKVIWDLYPGLVDTNIHAHYLKAAKQYSLEHYEAQSPLNGRWYEIFMQGWKGGVDVYMRDITERKQAEEQLRKSEERFQNLYEDAPVGYFEYDLWGNITQVNRTELKMLGYTAEEMIGQPCWNFIVGEAAREQILAKLSGDRPPAVGLERTYRRKDGTTFPVLFEDRLLTDEDGHITGIRTAIQDISERKEAEEALHESRDLLDTTQRLAGVGGWVWDVARRTMTWTDQTYRIHGFEPGEVAAGSPEHVERSLACYDPDDRPVIEAAFLRCAEEGIPYDLEFPFTTVDGRRRCIQTTAQPLFDGQRVVKVIGNIVDITERKQEEETLRKTSESLQAILDNNPLLISEFDLEGRYIRVNHAVAKLLERHSSELVGKTFDEILPAETAELFMERLDLVSNARKPITLEDHLVTPEGGQHFITTIFPLFDASGQIRSIGGIAHNITERHRMQEKIRQVSDELLRASRMALVGGWSVDLKTGEHEWSEVTREIHKVGPDFIPDFQTAIAFYKEGESRRKITDAVTRCMETREPYDVDVQIVTAKGNECWVRTMGTAEFQDRRCVRLHGTFQDITERKQIEQEREKLQAQLTQAQKMESVGRLAGGVAHDLNNMLSVIMGNTEIALEKVDPTQPLHDNLQEIQKAAQRSTNVVRQLLAFARKQTISPKVLDLNDTVEEMLKMLRRLIGEDIDLSWQLEYDIWPVKMDPAQIDQILANLCVNARDAIRGVGKLTIETDNVSFNKTHCARHPYLVPGDFVLLAISDDGCGMDKETLDNIFEPFFTTKEVGQGTGLGLATVYGIVKQNNGFINVYSEPNQGTTFKIYLPRHQTADEPVRAENSDDCEVHGDETILLVEDEATILKMARMMLERLGYTVLIAATPGEAMDVARMHSEEIDLLMTDVVMPEMNGRDLAEKLLSLYPNLKWLFMSGYTENSIAHHRVLDEGVHFIQKPFSKQDLSVQVRKVLDGKD
ncbi:MAG: PAS domain S-box protein [Desulfovermiculus sp.]